jgi:hypothetical protein
MCGSFGTAILKGCAARKNNRKYKIGIKYFQRYLLIQEEQVNVSNTN